MNNNQPARQSVIVIVDDEKMVTSSLSAFLEWETEHRILTFQSPVEAIETIRDHPIDLVIADFLMPEMNGLQFLKRVKEIYPEIQIQIPYLKMNLMEIMIFRKAPRVLMQGQIQSK